MYLLMDNVYDDNLEKYLKTQVGIKNIKLKKIDFKTNIEIDYDKNVSPLTIMKYIEIYENSEESKLIEFNKSNDTNYKMLKYTVADMCCEYCYKILVMSLFKDKNIKSVKSNFSFNESAFNIEFIIEYYNYKEDELIKMINDNK